MSWVDGVRPYRRSDEQPLTDPAEVAEARQILLYDSSGRPMGPFTLGPGERITVSIAPGTDPDWLSEAEAFDSAAELAERGDWASEYES